MSWKGGKEMNMLKTLNEAISWCWETHINFPVKPAAAMRRWDKSTPYGVHPIWCAMTFLQETDLPPDINREICALVLLFHDVKEDTIRELPPQIQEEIVLLIEQMTFAIVNSTQAEIEQVWNLPPIVRLLKLYDKVSNLMDGCWMTDEKWNRQYVPYVRRLADDVERNFGLLNIVRLARAIAVLRI